MAKISWQLCSRFAHFTLTQLPGGVKKTLPLMLPSQLQVAPGASRTAEPPEAGLRKQLRKRTWQQNPTVPATVVGISDNVFRDCKLLNSVEAPGCLDFGYKAFAECCSQYGPGTFGEGGLRRRRRGGTLRRSPSLRGA